MQNPKKRKRGKSIVLLLIVLAAGGGLTFRYYPKNDEIITVQVEPVTRRDVTETVVANGRIQPVTQVVISPEVAGEIVELPVVEGQLVKKGDLLLQIKPDNYVAGRNSAEASYKFALGARSQAEAELEKAASDFKRNEELFKNKLISASAFMDVKTTHEVARLRLENSINQVDQSRFALDKAADDLAKTKIQSPIDGTVTKLKSQLGERVLGTSFNMGTDMMTIARLDAMEARVDIGEIDVVLITVGQNARLEVDAFKDRKFKGTVTAIANAAKGPALGAAQSQDAPKFEVKIRVDDTESFRPGMSVTAEIETRSQKNVLTVPIQSVTTRIAPGVVDKPKDATPPPATTKLHEAIKPQEVVFVLDGDHVKKVPVKTGISDNDHFEIVSGLDEGQKVVSGGYKAIGKDLEDGKKVKLGADATASPKDAK